MRKHTFVALAAVVAGVTLAACADAPSAPNAPATRPDPIAAFAKGGNGNGNNGNGKGNGGSTDGSTGTTGGTTSGTTSGTSTTDDIVAYLGTLRDTVSRETQKVTGMQRLTPLASKQSASAVIGAEGGMVQLPTAGAYLWVPPGAVRAPTTFSVTAHPGKVVAYDFQPAGAVFNIPLVLIQDTGLLNAAKPAGVNSGALAYYTSDAAIDPVAATATASQMRFPLSFSTGQYMSFPVWHFSGYIVSWGFR